MKLIITFFMSCFMICSLFAGTLTGNVADAMTGEDLIRANISVFQKGVFLVGTVSDVDGEYQFELDAGDYEIEVSYIGYETQKVRVVLSEFDENEDLSIELDPGIFLAEIVITTYKVPLISRDICCGGCYGRVCRRQYVREDEMVEVEEKEEVIAEALGISYYPNPTTDLLNVVLPQASKSLTIRSIDGKELLHHSNLLEGIVMLDVSGYSAGTYILQVLVEGELRSEKVIVARE